MTRRPLSDIERATRDLPSVRFSGLSLVASILRWTGVTVLVVGLIGTAILTLDLYSEETTEQAFVYALASLITVATTSGVTLGLGYFFDMSIAVADDVHLALEAYLDDDLGD